MVETGFRVTSAWLSMQYIFPSAGLPQTQMLRPACLLVRRIMAAAFPDLVLFSIKRNLIVSFFSLYWLQPCFQCSLGDGIHYGGDNHFPVSSLIWANQRIRANIVARLWGPRSWAFIVLLSKSSLSFLYCKRLLRTILLCGRSHYWARWKI